MATTTTDWNPGRQIHMARFAGRISQKELAEALGVSRPLVSKWEREKAFPDVSQWRAMLRFFEERGVPDSDLPSLTWSLFTTQAA